MSADGPTSGDTRVLRILRALEDAPDGLSAVALAGTLNEGSARRAAMNRCRATLQQCAAAGQVEIAGKTAETGRPGPPRNIWRVTSAGRRKIAREDEAPEEARQAQKVLREARDQFGPGTPAAVRRQAAAVLRSAGFSYRQIGEGVFGVSPGTVHGDLRGALPGSPPGDLARALQDIACRAEDVQQALREARSAFGRDTPLAIRREAAAVLHDLGRPVRDIGAMFGVSDNAIQQDVRRPRPSSPAGDPLHAICGLARRSEQARQALRDARDRLGPGTPAPIRQEAAGILRAAGVTPAEIGAAFSVSRHVIRGDLRGRPAGACAGDPAQALGELARRAQQLAAAPPAGRS